MQTTKKLLERPWAPSSIVALITIPIGVLALSGLAASQVAKPSARPLAKKSLPALKSRVAFPQLRFDRPIALASPDDGTNLLYVAEQHTAMIWSFPNQRATADKKRFAQLRDPINKGNEEGLLGLAFHLKYRENKQFYIYYSANDSGSRHSVVSRFLASSSDLRFADPASEGRIWVSAQYPFENHNGGTIAFGPDGYLYITLGDGGAAADPLRKSNDKSFASTCRSPRFGVPRTVCLRAVIDASERVRRREVNQRSQAHIVVDTPPSFTTSGRMVDASAKQRSIGLGFAGWGGSRPVSPCPNGRALQPGHRLSSRENPASRGRDGRGRSNRAARLSPRVRYPRAPPAFDQATATPDLGICPHPELCQRDPRCAARMQLSEEATAWHRMVLGKDPKNEVRLAALARLRTRAAYDNLRLLTWRSSRMLAYAARSVPAVDLLQGI